MRRMLWAALPLVAAVSIATADERSEKALDMVRRMETKRIELAQKLAPAVCAVFKGQGGGSGVIIHNKRFNCN